jgi:hypothetical protein
VKRYSSSSRPGNQVTTQSRGCRQSPAIARITPITPADLPLRESHQESPASSTASRPRGRRDIGCLPQQTNSRPASPSSGEGLRLAVRQSQVWLLQHPSPPEHPTHHHISKIEEVRPIISIYLSIMIERRRTLGSYIFAIINIRLQIDEFIFRIRSVRSRLTFRLRDSHTTKRAKQGCLASGHHPRISDG